MKLKSDMELKNVPADVNYDDATITCWDGEAFVRWDKWRLSMPVGIDADSAGSKSESIADGQKKRVLVDQENLFPSDCLGDYSE